MAVTSRLGRSGAKWILLATAACAPETPDSAPSQASPTRATAFVEPPSPPPSIVEEGGVAAYHGARGLEARFEASAVEIRASRAAAPARFRLAEVGRRHRRPVGPVRHRKVTGDGVRYQHATAVETRYAPVDAGLEQSFELAERPPGSGARVELAIAVGGGLRPERHEDEGPIRLQDADGVAHLSYGKLAVYDVDGTRLPSSMGVREGQIVLRYEDTQARYPVVVDPIIVTARTKIVPPDPAEGLNFGGDVAVWKDTLVVGTNVVGNESEDGPGATYVYVRKQGSWRQQVKLVPNDVAPGDSLGIFVDVYDNTIVASATGQNDNQGAVYVFVRNGQMWRRQARLEPKDGASGDGFGVHVTLWNDTVLAGAPGRNNNAGAAYVFVREGEDWSQQASLKPGDGRDKGFGSQVALWHDTAAVGEEGDDQAAENAGAVYLFNRRASQWMAGEKVTADNARAEERFPYNDLVLHGQTLAGTVSIAYPSDEVESPNRVYVFEQRDGSWAQQATLTDPTPDIGGFGISTAVWNDWLVVSDVRLPRGRGRGNLHVRRQSTGESSYELETTVGPETATGAVGSVALHQETAVLGTPFVDEGVRDTGAAFVYELGHEDGPAPDAGSGAATPPVDAGSDAGMATDAGNSLDGGPGDDPPLDAGSPPSSSDEAGEPGPPGAAAQDGAPTPDGYTGRPDASTAGPDGILTTWGCGCRVPAHRPRAPALAAIALAAFVIPQRRRATKRRSRPTIYM